MDNKKMKSQKLKFIDLVLENCEIIRVNVEYIEAFSIDNIAKSIHFTNEYGTHNSFKAEEFLIKISSTFNTHSGYATNWNEGKTRLLPFSRLMDCNDITAISLYFYDSGKNDEMHFEDGSEEYIYMNWCGDDDYNNPYQTSTINGYDGGLFIMISPTDTAKEYLNRNG